MSFKESGRSTGVNTRLVVIEKGSSLTGKSEVKHSLSSRKREVQIPIIGEDNSCEGRRLAKALERSIKRERRTGKNDPKSRGRILPVRVQPEFEEKLGRIAGLL